MATLDVLSTENKKVGSIDLPDSVFGVEVNIPLVHQVLKAQLAARRQGTAKTKVKSEVRGGGRKPFRQKGTGNARQGSSRSPLHPGGGQSFGPQPRSYEQFTPKEMVRGALRSALSDRLAGKHLLVVDQFSFSKVSTKELNAILKTKFKLDKTVIIDVRNEKLELSGRNIPKLKILREDVLNVYDLVKHDWVVLSKAAAEKISARLAPGAAAEAKTAAQAMKKASKRV